MATRDAVFVTGATGLVGAGVLRQALRDNSSLDRVRPGPHAGALARARGEPRPASGAGDAGRRRRVRRRARPLVRRSRHPARRVTAVVHSAGDIVFTPAAGGIAAHQRRRHSPPARAGRWLAGPAPPGAREHCICRGPRTGTVLEADNGVDAGWINGYEQAKYEAEALVRDCGCSWAIARPSTVVCDAVDGPVSRTSPSITRCACGATRWSR